MIRTLALLGFALPTALATHALLFAWNGHTVGGTQHLLVATALVTSLLVAAASMLWSLRTRISVLPGTVPLAATTLLLFGGIEALEPHHHIPLLGPLLVVIAAIATHFLLASAREIAWENRPSTHRPSPAPDQSQHWFAQCHEVQICAPSQLRPRAPPSFVCFSRA